MAFAILVQLSLAASALAGVIKLGTEKHAVTPRDLVHRDVVKRFETGQTIGKRANTILESLYNNRQQGGYFINITVGTPPQPLSVILDTGSSDLWLLSTDTDLCKSPSLQASLNEECYGGVYDAGASSTYKSLIPGGFQIQYVDESESAGDYITDNVGLSGNNVIKNLQMGLSLKSTVGVGIMGVGYTENEAAEVKYPNIIDELVSQGLIATKAYSLYLDTREATHGEILFGGLDAKKFIGQLTTLPLQARRSASVNSFTVAMTGLSIGPKDNLRKLTSTSFAIATLLDSGTTLTYLPDALVANLIQIMGAYDDIEQNGSIWVDCSLPETYPDYVIAYQFGGPNGPTINVPLKEVIFDLPDGYQSYFNLPWKTTCFLGIMPSGGDSHYLLGDSFLRSAYVVYDIDNNELSIANTNFEATEEEIIEITKGSTIPQATGVANQVTVTADEEGLGGVGDRTSAITEKITATGTNRPVLIGGGAKTTSDVSGTETAGAENAQDSEEGAGARLTPGGSFSIMSLITVWGAFAVLGGAAVLA